MHFYRKNLFLLYERAPDNFVSGGAFLHSSLELLNHVCVSTTELWICQQINFLRLFVPVLLPLCCCSTISLVCAGGGVADLDGWLAGSLRSYTGRVWLSKRRQKGRRRYILLLDCVFCRGCKLMWSSDAFVSLFPPLSTIIIENHFHQCIRWRGVVVVILCRIVKSSGNWMLWNGIYLWN